MLYNKMKNANTNLMKYLQLKDGVSSSSSSKSNQPCMSRNAKNLTFLSGRRIQKPAYSTVEVQKKNTPSFTQSRTCGRKEEEL